MSILSLNNLIAYSIQITAVIGAGALLSLLLRLRAPSARIVWLQTVLLLCVVVPALQSWQSSPPPRPANAAITAVATPITGLARQASSGRSVTPFAQPVLLVCALGISLRLLWTLLGFFSLQRYRRQSRTIRISGSETERFLNGITRSVRFAVSDRIASPITFGLFSPLVLLPTRFEQMSRETREAILCHELLHVRRNDWLWRIAEECILAVLWFQPAVWWLISQIRLCREQVVDQQVIRITGSPDLYVSALLDAAHAPGSLRPVFANAFSRRGHIVQRVSAILEGNTVSLRRLVPSLSAVLAGTLLVARLAIVAFPLHSNASAQQAPEPLIQIETGGDHLLRRAALEYPEAALANHISGLVEIQVTTDNEGNVADVHVLNGPQHLRRSVLQSVLDWKYDPQQHPAGVSNIAIRFNAPDPTRPAAPILPALPASAGAGNKVVIEMAEKLAAESEDTRVVPSEASAAPGTIREYHTKQDTELAITGRFSGQVTGIALQGLAEHLPVTEALTLKLGSAINAGALAEARESLRKLDPRLKLAVAADEAGQITLIVFGSEAR